MESDSRTASSEMVEFCTHGSAAILAMGTAVPPMIDYQAEYPDYYFRVTKTEHETELKEKFKRICDKSMIRKRHTYITEEMLKKNPNIADPTTTSLDTRLDADISEAPKLAAEAATEAIKEWGQPLSSITHLVLHSTLGIVMPGADYQLAKILGLRPSVKRFMLNHLGCYAGGTVLRLAKDLAENNPGARVLAVCSEVNVGAFREPSYDYLDILVGHAIFGAGAAALIVGANPNTKLVVAPERPLYQIVSACQNFIPESEDIVGGRLREVGLIYYLSRNLSSVVADNIEECLIEAFKPVGGISDWNSIFWAVHPGGRAILDKVQEKLGLSDDKLAASRHVLSEYGNMLSTCVLFVLDEIRKRSADQGSATTGEGLQWGVLIGIGPGVTVETVVLQSIPQPPARNSSSN